MSNNSASTVPVTTTGVPRKGRGPANWMSSKTSGTPSKSLSTA